MLTSTVVLLVALIQATVIAWRAFYIDDAILNTSGTLVQGGCKFRGRAAGRVVTGWGA
ncbi:MULTISPECIES: hypothetical protein [Streptomyces]|uniref:hypothetical protein n=1 Tax=Streptomyces TaxID=1883 RepID=UPI000F2B7A1C|nr:MULTISPECIES: hypothetical protein [Streptomyces]MCX4430465.1 hypothetical protein [Streptomyces mirabilis]